jgi:hypothetical protein
LLDHVVAISFGQGTKVLLMRKPPALIVPGAVRARETLAGLADPTVDRIVEILCADDERLSRVCEAIHAIGRLAAALDRRMH